MSQDAKYRARALLNALAVAEGCRSPKQIAELTGIKQNRVSQICAALLTRGMVEQVKDGCFRLTPVGDVARLAAAEPLRKGPTGPHTGLRKPRAAQTFQQRLWKVLRLNPKATVSRLVQLAGDGRQKQETRTAQHYLLLLRRGGIVVEMRQRAEPNYPNSRGEKRWMVVNDLGPEAPIWRAGKRAFFDPNKGVHIEVPHGH